MNALEFAGISHRFGGRIVLRDVSISVRPKSLTVLVGRNGAGKTTLVSLATGLYHAREGAVFVFGHCLRRNPADALRNIGVVFQELTLDLDLSVRENLDYHASLHGIAPNLARERQIEELGRIGLLDRANERVRTLSGGLRRRVEIVRALLHRPGLLLLDEPTVGLDPESRRAILDYVRRLCRDQGLAILWTTHLLDEVAPDDMFVALNEGAVAWQGVAEDLPNIPAASWILEGFTFHREQR
jgi:ABC-2 type transport system ATP-binding protein